MPHYRIYLLDPDDRIQSAHDADCSTDCEATKFALQIADDKADAEIWQATRILGRVRPNRG
jgi:hypothetical protein